MMSGYTRKFFFFVFLALSIECYGISYLPGIEDVPLMESMVVEEPPTVFDKVEGRVVVVKTETKRKPSQVELFYREILFNLGWVEISKNQYQREQQVLTIEIQQHAENQGVVFELRETA